ncbi:MAG: universal stress protein [Thermoproteota archaeon]|nr:universal stress protein [Thermoproteota archaeon]
MAHLNSRYSKILVGLDGSDDSMKAADHAIAIAKLHSAKLLTVHVIPSQIRSGGYSSSIATPTFPEYSKRSDESAETWFGRIKRNAGEAGVEVETKVISSGYSVGQVIVDLAEKENVDLVVVGTRGMTGFKKMLLGSVALEVVTYSDCSVIVVK